MKQKWSVREYKEGDEVGIFELCKAVYPEGDYEPEHWMRWWRWLYKDNPIGAARIWLAEHDGKIVGQYPLVYMKMKVGNKILKASKNLDLMTHPDYRYQGIFSKLERHALDEAEKEGVYITFGFPSPNTASYPGHIKSGWFDVGTMRPMFKPLNWVSVLKTRIKNNFLRSLVAIGASLVLKGFARTQGSPTMEGLTITQISSFDDRIDDFWARVSDQYEIMIVRDKDYLNWRYGAPDANNSLFLAEKAEEIYGYLVLCCQQEGDIRVSSIFDIMAKSEEIIRCLVSRAIEYCKQEKVDLIIYAAIANKTYRRALRKSGFISIPFMKADHFCAYSSSPDIPIEFLKDAKNWLVQIGDSDAVE